MGLVTSAPLDPAVSICRCCWGLLVPLLNKPCHLLGLPRGEADADTSCRPLDWEKLLSGEGTFHVAALMTGKLVTGTGGLAPACCEKGLADRGLWVIRAVLWLCCTEGRLCCLDACNTCQLTSAFTCHILAPACKTSNTNSTQAARACNQDIAGHDCCEEL